VSATTSIGIHFGTFALADDGEAAPVERLRAALQGREDAGRFRVLVEGEGHAVP
jgi:hypothetical protein